MSEGWRFLIASDMDRTMMPNGPLQFDPNMVSEFNDILEKNDDVAIAYMTGRHLSLALEGISEFDLPEPDVIVGDVGTSVYEKSDGRWVRDGKRDAELAQKWGGYGGREIASFLDGVSYLKEQEGEKLTYFKQSYYVGLDVPPEKMKNEISGVLQERGVNAHVIYSVDEAKKVGLVDVIPSNGGKDATLGYLQKKFGLEHDNVMYAGDSGNDILALTSGYNAMVVNNARDEVKEAVKKIAEKKGISDRVYFAQKNYTAGVLEGAFHFGIFERDKDG